MDIDENPHSTPPPQPQVLPQVADEQPSSMSLSSISSACTYSGFALSPTPQPCSIFATPVPPRRRAAATSTSAVFQTPAVVKDVPVKVHVRRPDKDNWAYLGRAVVSQEAFGQGTRIVVRALSSRKVVTAFSQGLPIQAEKRGNFVVVSCVDGGRVVAWSLNALNTSDTIRLLAILNLTCLVCGKDSLPDPQQNTNRRRVARVIREDKKRRHKRRRDQDSMIAAFAKTGLGESSGSDRNTPSDTEQRRTSKVVEH
ncbi:hypothetical protein EIP86_007583 [Pleurotus ostreatoroseus]|nr:hypothetical protein EIP86_007583 [Pleurotus ostreatoroseus]